MQNPTNPTNPNPQVPPRANNYPIQTQNQNWNVPNQQLAPISTSVPVSPSQRSPVSPTPRSPAAVSPTPRSPVPSGSPNPNPSVPLATSPTPRPPVPTVSSPTPRPPVPTVTSPTPRPPVPTVSGPTPRPPVPAVNGPTPRPPVPAGGPTPRSPPAGPMFNNRPPISSGPMFNNRPPIVPQRSAGTGVPTQSQQNQMFARPPLPPQGSTEFVPPPPQNNFPTKQFSNRSAPPNNNGNIQVNLPNQNIQQRRTYSQKSLPDRPIMPKKSTTSLSRSASRLKSKFVDMVQRVPTIGRTLSTRKRQEKARRLSKYGGMNVHSAYRNSLMVKPVFESKLLLQPQNPNFIISLGIIVMIAAVSLSIAAIAFKNGGLTEQMIHDISSEDTYGFIFFSLFMLLIAFTGYISYHKKWTSLLITYGVFIIFGFIVQLIIISLFLNIYFHPVVQMRSKWQSVLSDEEKQNIQENYQCCGFLSVIDHGVTTSMCFPDTGSTTLPIRTVKSMVNNFNYLDVQLRKRQVDGVDAGAVGGAVDDGAAAGGAGDPAAGGDAGVADAGVADAGAADDGAAAGGAADTGAGDNTAAAGDNAAAGNAAAAGDNAAAAAGNVVAGVNGVDGTGSTNTTDIHAMKEFYKTKDPNSYTMDDIKEEGCAKIIVGAVKSGLLYYILIEVLMALSFIGAFYYAYMHFREQLDIEKEIDSARATFG